MFIVRRISRLRRSFQFALVGVAAFAIGSATIAAASTAGIPVGSLFYLPMINGTATTPCSTATGTYGATTTCNAVVDSTGNLHVTSQGTSTVSGSVGVNNFPADQQVHGTVGVNNLSADQMVHGMVGINNFPATQAVSGTVSVGNLPTDGSGNLKVAPQGTQNVNIVGGSPGSPVATRGMLIQGPIAANGDNITVNINMKVTYLHVEGCTFWDFSLSGGGILDVRGTKDMFFPVPLDITSVRYANEDIVFGCNPFTQVIGY